MNGKDLPRHSSSMPWPAATYEFYCATSRAYRPQRGRGHVTAILFCIPSKIQIRQWFVTNYNCCLECTTHTEDFTIFSLDMNFARYLVTCPLQPPLGVYTPLAISISDQTTKLNDSQYFSSSYSITLSKIIQGCF